VQSYPVDTDIIFVGHSIGCYVLLEVIKRDRRLLSMSRDIVFIMPFLFWKNLPLAHKLNLTLYKHFRFILKPFIIFILSSIPSRLFHGLIGSKLSSYCSFIISEKLMNTRILENFFTLAIDEINCVRSEECKHVQDLQDFNVLENILNEKIRFHHIYTNDDVWAPRGDYELMKRIFGDDHVHYLPHITHGFTLSKYGVELVTQKLSLLLFE
jgi:hypothetical protein